MTIGIVVVRSVTCYFRVSIWVKAAIMNEDDLCVRLQRLSEEYNNGNGRILITVGREIVQIPDALADKIIAVFKQHVSSVCYTGTASIDCG
jgi:hypothetical protein